MAFSIKEIIDLAVQIEETGHEFYSACEKKFADQKFKDLFSFLSGEELKHKKTFLAMRDQNYSLEGAFDEDYHRYLKAIGGSKIFVRRGNVKKLMDEISSPVEAIQQALADEKQSILFYGELKPLYPLGKEAWTLLDKIMDEERSHVKMLIQLLEKE